MILVTGATGTVGSELVAQLRDSKLEVRALVHDPKKTSRLGDKVEIAVGDLDQPETLRPAMESVHAVYAIAFFTEQIRNLVDAAKHSGVKLIVRQSTIEAGATPPIGPGKWHREQEEIIERSGLAWVHLRPTLMMTNIIQWWSATIRAQGRVYFPGGPGRTAPVDPYDVAAVASSVLTAPHAHEGKAYDVTGPEPFTVAEMVQVLSKAVGKPIRYVRVPALAAGWWMRRQGLSRELVAALMETQRAWQRNRYAYVADTVERLTGRPGRTFEAWCRAHAAAFAGGPSRAVSA